MATISINTPDNIEFKNLVGGERPQDAPTLTIQAGDWENGKTIEAGIVFEVLGSQAPMLTSNDARKLAKWLTRAAESLDGVKDSRKKSRSRHYRDNDEDEDEFGGY